MKTARFSLTESCYLKQAGQVAPEFVGASPASPVVVVLPDSTKERKGLKRLPDGEAPKAEKVLPAHAGLESNSPRRRAAEHYSVPAEKKPEAPAPAPTSALPVEGTAKKGGRAADKD